MTKRKRQNQIFHQLLALKAAGLRVELEPRRLPDRSEPAHNFSLTRPRAIRHAHLTHHEARVEARDHGINL